MRERLNVANIAMGFALFVWGGLYLLGSSLASEAANRRVPGLPNAGQLAYYLGFPTKMTMLLLIVTIICASGKRWAGFQLTAAIIALLAFFPYIIFYTGGI
ncbi:hypothetical protein HRJ34_00560 [Rhizorhabdus wittichii]|uniref:Uncharacterized protein n=1 Tax=Rhizorhabdus wittichii TaxID=160791 RepID=A0A975D3M3_9SPHN|nr:hypothetical protein [Rhizorhabdus wittichii]QTH22069.1 hypothetical protein HRJ34_00560 [Rhizorhabdus wittichii]